MFGRFVLHVVAWAPGAALAWLAAPFLVPESWRTTSLGVHAHSVLQLLVVFALVFVAARGAAEEPKPAPGALRVLATGALFLGASLASFFWAGLAPTRSLARRCHDGPIAGVACERYTQGFSPDVPFYRLQTGEVAPGACPAPGVSTLPWPLLGELRELQLGACPDGLVGDRCFEARWTGASSGQMLLLVAFAPACDRGLELFGRGPAALTRRERLTHP